MAAPTIADVSYPTFADATVAYGTQVIQDLTDIIAFLTDGTKDFTIGDIDITGDAILGSAVTDSITINGGIAANLLPFATATTTLGSFTNTWAALCLDAGVGSGGSIYFNASTYPIIQAAADGSSISCACDASSSWSLDGDGDFTVTDTGAVDVEIVANSQSTGDAVLKLMVNNAAANTWDFRNDNSASDILLIRYNATNALTLTTAGEGTFTADVNAVNFVGSGYATADYFLPTADDATPTANCLYKANVPKAWAHMDIGAAGAVTVTDDHNIESASWANTVLTVTISTNMANATYFAIANISYDVGLAGCYGRSQSHAAGDFDIVKYDPATGAGTNWISTDDAECYIIGDQ